MASKARHQSTQHLIGLFEHAHLPADLAVVSAACSDLACDMVGKLCDGPELTTGLRKLLEAKDCFVRQRLIDARAD